MNLKDYIYDVPNYPKEGILFRDITPLLKSKEAFEYAVKEMADFVKKCGATVIMGPESRGFIFGCPVATNLGIGFIPVRKKGKLPRETISVKYELEYGSDELFMHKDALKSGDRVVLIDDLVAIGGTLNAVAELVESTGAKVVGALSVITLKGLPGEELLKKYNLKSLLYLED